MSSVHKRWTDGLQYSSLFWPPPSDEQQRQAQVMAYVEYFGQFTLERLPAEVDEIIRKRYPSKEVCLLDNVLATFVLHHPEHGHAVIHPILSCIIDDTLLYNKNDAPFSSFISLFSPKCENDYLERWALACGEILRVLTHYNRPVYKDQAEKQTGESERSSSGGHASTSNRHKKEAIHPLLIEHERKPLRPLTPWITDILIAAPLAIQSDYFRWCGGVMGKYAAGGELKPPTTAVSRQPGKHPQLMPSTPRWAVANGAGVILSICDEEVARYETSNLTAAAVLALLLPPPTTDLDEHLVTGLPALEPYARLFHRYYAIATPSATQRLLLGLLEAPPSWAPDALDAAVQLVELLRAAEDHATGMRLPRNWMYLHFLRAIGTAMSMRAGIAADAAAALLFRILSLPSLLFPLPQHGIGVDIQHGTLGSLSSCYRKQQSDQTEPQALEATIEATAQGIASLFCLHGPEVEWRICTIWEAAYGLVSLSSSSIDLPEIVVATPLQPPVLSWNLYLPLLKVLEYLPRGGPAEACLMRIFFATVEAILRRTFPLQHSRESTKKSRVANYRIGSNSKNLAVAEFRTIVHFLFVESNASPDLASRLLFVVLAGCISHEALPKGTKSASSGQSVEIPSFDTFSGDQQAASEEQPDQANRKKGPVAAFDSYVLAAVCALACELQLFPLISQSNIPSSFRGTLNMANINGTHSDLRNGVYTAVCHTRRFLGILEALLKPSSVGAYGSNEIVAAAMVAAHVSELFRRSKPCMHALTILMRCKWDKEIFNKASSLYHLIDIHGKTVSSILDKATPLEAHVLHVLDRKVSNVCYKARRQLKRSNVDASKEDTISSSLKMKEITAAEEFLKSDKAGLLTNVMLNESGKSATNLPVDALDLANFLTMDGYAGFSCKAQILLRSILVEKQELCFSVVSLLWHKLIDAPEMKMNVEGTSAQQGWRQVVDALCNVVLASPVKASTAIVLQADMDLQPWIAKDDEQSQKMWRINQRIVCLLAELLRNHDTPEALMIIASASDLLLRATDGMLVDGEACTLPQLELLEATARAVELVFNLGYSGFAIADGLSNLLKCRLPAAVRCLSHRSAHVRALSTSLLRDILHIDSLKFYPLEEDVRGIPAPPYRKLAIGTINWHADLEKWIAWEVQSRRAAGLTLALFFAAAKDLGCAVPD